MHNLGVYHGDLNASNILVRINEESSNKPSNPSTVTTDIYIIDFDKSFIGVNQRLVSGFMRNNLSRLRRSLIKLGYRDHLEKYWKSLIEGYSLR